MEHNQRIQIVDPRVTRVKFEEQSKKFKAVEHVYRLKGILLTRCEYPTMNFLFTVPKLNPAPIAFAIQIDLTNFDAEPPSVVFINPFTGEFVRRENIRLVFPQFNLENPVFQPPNDLVQGGGNIRPFLCIPGVKEYHDHPAHSGDSWFLYRSKGEGELMFILDQLYFHSVATVKSYILNMEVANLQMKQEVAFQQPLNFQ